MFPCTECNTSITESLFQILQWLATASLHFLSCFCLHRNWASTWKHSLWGLLLWQSKQWQTSQLDSEAKCWRMDGVSWGHLGNCTSPFCRCKAFCHVKLDFGRFCDLFAEDPSMQIVLNAANIAQYNFREISFIFPFNFEGELCLKLNMKMFPSALFLMNHIFAEQCSPIFY